MTNLVENIGWHLLVNTWILMSVSGSEDARNKRCMCHVQTTRNVLQQCGAKHKTTGKHSSRMRTARFPSSGGGYSPSHVDPLDADPSPWMQIPFPLDAELFGLDADPLGCRPPPPECRPPPPGCRALPPECRPPPPGCRALFPGCRLPPLEADPPNADLLVDRMTDRRFWKHYLPAGDN